MMMMMMMIMLMVSMIMRMMLELSHYRKNNNSSALIHDLSQVPLLPDQEEKYYRTFYTGPGQARPEDHCVQAYFGLVKKYRNIHEDETVPAST